MDKNDLSIHRVMFSRNIRFKQRYNITEAAFMVDYKDSKYFKKEFGKSPNHFRNDSKKMDLDTFLKKYNINYLSDVE